MSDTPIFEHMVNERWPLLYADGTIADFPPVPDRIAELWLEINAGALDWFAS